MLILDLSTLNDDDLIAYTIDKKYVDSRVIVSNLSNPKQAQILGYENSSWKSIIFDRPYLTTKIARNLIKNESWVNVHFEHCDNMKPEILKLLVSNQYWKNMFLGSTKLCIEACKVLVNSSYHAVDLYNTDLNDTKLNILSCNNTWKVVNLCGNFDLSIELLNKIDDHLHWKNIFSYYIGNFDNWGHNSLSFFNGKYLDEKKLTPI